MSTLRIVLVDDHEVVLTGLKALVDSSPGLRVVGEAKNGLGAVELARELRPDVIVLDVSMPEMDGATAAERIARECPEVRIVALTAHDDRVHLARLLQAGALGYVLKRGAADDLVRAIWSVAEGRTYVDPALAGRVLRRAAHPLATDPSRILDPLSEREEEVLRLIAWGHSNKEIAGRLEVSTKTVETYKARIGDKLGLQSRPEMVRYALQRGWLVEG